MAFSIIYLERREGDSPSIERVFRSVAENVSGEDFLTRFARARYGNSFLATLGNLLFFRPDAADIYHITGHISYMALVLPRKKTVLTIHDLTILDFRTGLRKWLIKWLYFILPARRALYITAISDASRTKLARIADISVDRVKVIQNPLLVSQSLSRAFNSDRPTILQIGTAANKNVDRLIEALKDIPCRLRIIGPVSDGTCRRLDEVNIDWSNSSHLNDAAIEAEYENSDIVALCSLDEGFGLPIIEAQAKGKAVITSDRSPMKDVAGAGAYLVDPESSDSIRKGILVLIENGDLRQRLVDEGRQNILRFDPTSIAAEYMEVYEQVIERRNKL